MRKNTRNFLIGFMIIILISMQSASAATLVIPGPTLDGYESGWSEFGLLIQAQTNVNLESVRFPNQGLADVIELRRHSDGILLKSVATPAGNTNITVSIKYPLTAGVTYRLLATTSNNRRFAYFYSFPVSNANISVISSYGNGGSHSAWWASFNDITTATCVSPPSGMVSWWPGDGYPNDIQDGNHGTLVNGATYGAGKVFQAFSFDGTNDYVSIPDGILPSTQRYFTLDAWVYPVDTNNRMMVFYAGASMGEYQLDIWDGNFRFCIKLTDANWYCATFGASSGQWAHLAGVRRNTTVELWVDGVLRQTTVAPALDLYITSGYHSDIGAYNRGDRYWDGLIDEVELFNRDLSQTEIQSIYDAGVCGKCALKTLIVTKAGNGLGTVTSNPTGINCGSSCSYDFDRYSTISLSAVPDPNSAFVGWSGDADCSDGQVVMNIGKTCTATFTLLPPPMKQGAQIPSLLPLLTTHLSQAKDVLTQTNDLLSQAKAKNLDTSTCEKIISEANELMKEANARKTSPVTANYYALKAIEKLKQAVDCLKALIG